MTILIDVREPEEFKKIPPNPNAVCLPMSRYAHWYTFLEKDEDYKIICHTNNRSKIVAKRLRDAGYNATHVENGMSELTGEDDCEACQLFKNLEEEKNES